jgi:RNA polymerase sigma-70 factor (ECF subfamily)
MCANLVESARAGDVAAFDRLVCTYQSQVYALAYRMLGNAEDASDIQQETFVKAWRKLGGFRGEAAFSTWLYRITVNLCISHKRRRTHTISEPFDESLHTPISGSVAFMEKTETLMMLRKVLDAMPANHRVLLVLRDMEDRPFEEIAELLGCSVGSVRVRLCKARSVLRERMRQYMLEEEV